MGLRLNLYHEVIKTRALKRRDPLKISIYVLSGIAACCAAWYAFEFIRYHTYLDDFNTKKAQFDKVEPLGKAAKKKQDQLTLKVNQIVVMAKRIEGRFYWAPVLSQISSLVPREVQITRLGGDVVGESSRQCNISIDGLAAGTDPRRVAEQLRTAIKERFEVQYVNVTSTFKSLEDGTETVLLDGRQMATAIFTISVQFRTGEDKPAQPQRHNKK